MISGLLKPGYKLRMFWRCQTYLQESGNRSHIAAGQCFGIKPQARENLTSHDALGIGFEQFIFAFAKDMPVDLAFFDPPQDELRYAIPLIDWPLDADVVIQTAERYLGD